jgi:hypothetical protein
MAARPDAVTLLVVTLATLGSACADPAGNDPNVPDESQSDAGTLATCSVALQSGCPPTLSYSTDIAPLVKRSCLPCHAPDGSASDHNLSTYAGLRRSGTSVLGQVNGCLMPPADAGPDAALTATDRTELWQWFLFCGSPNN